MWTKNLEREMGEKFIRNQRSGLGEIFLLPHGALIASTLNCVNYVSSILRVFSILQAVDERIGVKMDSIVEISSLNPNLQPEDISLMPRRELSVSHSQRLLSVIQLRPRRPPAQYGFPQFRLSSSCKTGEWVNGRPL
jgi:hypothetical protein